MASRRRATRRTLTGTIADIDRRLRYLSAQPAPSRLANQVVTRSTLQSRAVSNDKIALDAISNDQIQANAILAQQIKDGEIVTSKIGDLQITTAKIADLQITRDKIANLDINDAKLAPNAVITDKINNSAVTREKIASNAVGATQIENGSVGNSELSDNSVTSSKISDGSIGTNELSDGAVTRSKIASGAVGNAQLGGDSVTSAKIAANAVGTSEIANGTITAGKISSGSYSLIGALTTSTGEGLSRRGTTVSVVFGTGSGQVPRGNHRHSYTYQYYTRDSRGLGLQNLTTRANNTGTWSSKKYKKDIQSHKVSDPKKLLDLDLKKYKYKRSLGGEHEIKHREWMHGYLAEDIVDAGFEEIVHYDSEGNPDALDYGLFSTLVLELVKLQQTEIEYLKEEIKDLKEAK